MINLRKNGRFVEFMSKKYCINLILNIFREKGSNDMIRPVGKCFKNDNGEIYQIKSMICPCCESKPIGKMYLVKNINEKYLFRTPSGSATNCCAKQRIEKKFSRSELLLLCG